uniref:Uncharacterized protein n=1 Tax=Rousettus aegyptiacus TaxID=9407 RepID=A0A7J8HR58_ROUAE|nr:hypothetical protein HJG63_010967 [Rousettus aegyptiacus]
MILRHAGWWIQQETETLKRILIESSIKQTNINILECLPSRCFQRWIFFFNIIYQYPRRVYGLVKKRACSIHVYVDAIHIKVWEILSHLKTQQEDSHLHAVNRALTRSQTLPDLPGLQSPEL